MESTVTKFANFIEKSTDIEIPDSTLHSAKLIVADCLGAIVGGMAEPEIRMLAESKGENLFEILDNNKAGLLYEKNVSNDFVRAFKDFLNMSNAEIMHKKKNAMKKAKLFTIFNHSKDLHRIINELTSK